jgi:hypothetical protein
MQLHHAGMNDAMRGGFVFACDRRGPERSKKRKRLVSCRIAHRRFLVAEGKQIDSHTDGRVSKVNRESA